MPKADNPLEAANLRRPYFPQLRTVNIFELSAIDRQMPY